MHGNSITDIRTRIADAKDAARRRSADQPRVVLVPTMGALHDGHLRLVERAKELGEIVVVSIFVNPLQFGENEDLDAYPRTLDADTAKLARVGVDLVFAPTAAEMYPDGPAGTRVTAGAVGGILEGASRPGHFDGVLTVVAKLFSIVRPDVAMFGEKDRQQLFLIQRMVRDLNLDIDIRPVATVRAEDGLALSSRNAYLSDDERAAALAIPRALDAAEQAAGGGVVTARTAALDVLEAEPGIRLDYVALVDTSTFREAEEDHSGDAVVLIAGRVGTTRLIDNRTIFLG